MDDTAVDRKATQPVINQVVVYPLKDFDGRTKTTEDISCATGRISTA